MPDTAHTILVAFTVIGSDRKDAQRNLMNLLPQETETMPFPTVNGKRVLDSWYIAEDDRIDGSDYPSATFIPYKPVEVREKDRLQAFLGSAIKDVVDWHHAQDEEDAPEWDGLYEGLKDLRLD